MNWGVRYRRSDIKTIDKKITTVVKENFGVVSTEVTKNDANLATLKQKLETDVDGLNKQIAILRTQQTLCRVFWLII